MKKFLKTILFLCALSSIAYAEDDAMAILNKKKIQKLLNFNKKQKN